MMLILVYLINGMVLATIWPQAESGNVIIVKGNYQPKDVAKICAKLSATTFNEENVRMDNCIKSKFNLELFTEWEIPENSTEQIVVQIQDELKRSRLLINNAHIEALKLYLEPVSDLEILVDVTEIKEPSEPNIETKKSLDLMRYPRLTFWPYVEVNSQKLSTDYESYISVTLKSLHIPRSVVLQGAVEIYRYMQTAFKFPNVYITYPSPHGTKSYRNIPTLFKPFVYKMTVTDDNTCELLPQRLGPLCDVVDCYRYKRNDQIKVIIWAYPEIGVGRSGLKKALRSIHEDVEDLTNKYAGHIHSGISVEGIPKDWTEEYYDEASNKSKNILNTILKTMKVGLPNIQMDIHKYSVAVRPYKQVYVVLNFTLDETDNKTLVERSILETDDLIKDVFARHTKIRFAYFLPKESVTKSVRIKVTFRDRNTREKCIELINLQIQHIDKEAEFVYEENDENILVDLTFVKPFPTEEKVTQLMKDYLNQLYGACPMDIEVNVNTKKTDFSSDANSRSLNVLVFLTSIFVIIMTMI